MTSDEHIERNKELEGKVFALAAYFDWDYDSEQTHEIRKALTSAYNAGLDRAKEIVEERLFSPVMTTVAIEKEKIQSSIE